MLVVEEFKFIIITQTELIFKTKFLFQVCDCKPKNCIKIMFPSKSIYENSNSP